MKKTRAKRPLNVLQTDILLVLYKFRFASRDLIVKYQDLESKTYTHYRLAGLLEQEYIGRLHSPEDKINRRAASYFILPKGIRTLKQQYGLVPKVLNGMYKDHQASRQFIDRCLNTFSLYIKFNEFYEKSLSFYTKSELAEYDHFPRPLPDAFLKIGNADFFLELVAETTPGFAVKRLVQRYIKHCEDGDWEEQGGAYPYLLLVCSNASMERRVQKLTANLISRSDADELSVYTTTNRAILASGAKTDQIWSDVQDPEELLNLDLASASSSV